MKHGLEGRGTSASHPWPGIEAFPHQTRALVPLDRGMLTYKRTKRGTDAHTVAKLTLDLHDIYNRGRSIESELNRIIQEAVDKRIPLVEIIPGKGSGQLKKTVLRFLRRPEIRKLYHRVEKDSKDFGRLFVHFRHG